MITAPVNTIVSKLNMMMRRALKFLRTDTDPEEGVSNNNFEKTLIGSSRLRGPAPTASLRKESVRCFGYEVAINYNKKKLLESARLSVHGRQCLNLSKST